jgi:hypothetical protein
MFILHFNVQAQDEITDEELTMYAKVMIQIDSMKVGMKEKTNELVKGHDLMDGGRVYNAIKSAKGDILKLNELGITQEQLMVYNSLNIEIESMKEDFKTNYTEIITNEIGASTFNTVKRALSEDAIKIRYDSIFSNLVATETTSESVDEDEG